MSGPTPPSSDPEAPSRQRSGLRALSGSLGVSAAAAAWAEAAPALRSQLSQHSWQHQPVSQAPFAMRPLDPAASLEMFKRMRGGPPVGGMERPSPAKSHVPPLSLGDSARHTETECGTPTSQRSLLEPADEGWGLPLPASASAELLPAVSPSNNSSASSSGQPSPFAAAAARQLSTPTSSLGSPPSGRGSEGQRWAGGRAGTVTSWPSVLPQTEAELQGLDAVEVEHLAVEAAKLQARAAAALRLAQRRLQGATPDVPAASSDDLAAQRRLQTAAPAAASEGPGSMDPGYSAARAVPSAAAAPVSIPKGRHFGAPPATTLPPSPASLLPAAHRLLQLFILLLAAAEALLLWCANAVEVGSGGLLHVPRGLVLAPLAPTRAALPALLLTADTCLVLLALLRGQRWAAAGL